VVGLPAGRTMRIRCGGPLRVLRLVGLPDLPSVVIPETPGDQ
jgi:hypothetical protein